MKILKKMNDALQRQNLSSTQMVLALFVIALMIVAVAMARFGYKIGHKQGERVALMAKEKGEGEVVSVAEASLRQQLNAAVQERDISLSNLETLREKNEELVTKNLQVSQINGYLKDKLAKDGGTHLEIVGVEVVSLPDDVFEYRFDVAKIDKSGQPLSLRPRLTLLNATSMVNIPLKPAVYELKDISHIRGRFLMPKGFTPRQIKLELTTGNERIESLYNWRVGEPVAMREDKGISERPVGSP